MTDAEIIAIWNELAQSGLTLECALIAFARRVERRERR